MAVSVDHLLRRVEKPGRYIGGEYHSVVKDHGGRTTMAFAFPDLYDLGMAYVGMQILYSILNDRDDLVCERVFAPARDMEALMREEGIPLFSMETKTPLRDFDVVGFTLQYEMSFTNILNMLDLAQIPLHGEDRTEEDPLIICGGPCAFNPEPLADFVDVFLIGDGEDLLPEVVERYGKSESKAAFYRDICSLQGVYVPSLYEVSYNEDQTVKAVVPKVPYAPKTILRAFVEDLSSAPYPEKPIVPLVDVAQDRAVIEIFRGCTRGCRFCQAGMLYRPVREREPEEILAMAEHILDNTGHDELSLLSLSTLDYSRFEELAFPLIDLCAKRNVGLSLPSLRLDSVSFRVLEEIQKYRKTGLTFAPEAGTQRMRDVINKNITEEDIFGGISQAVALGWKHLKLYFMMGLPGETYEDLDGIADIAERVMELAREANGGQMGRFTVTVSVANFVPKPFTPFQWVGQDEDFTAKHDHLREKMRIKGVTFNYHDDPVSKLEAVFARGDRRTGYFLEEAWRNGCGFDSWSEQFNGVGWEMAKEAFEEKFGYSTEFYRTRVRPFDEVLPWDHIDCGVTKEFLRKEMEKAAKAVTTPDCRQGCQNCGINTKTHCPLGGIYA